MAQLEPSPHTDIVVPNFTVLELNGAYEVSFGMELPIDPSGADSLQVAGFTYEINLNDGTYTLTETDSLNLVAGPVGFSSKGLEAPALQTGVAGAGTTGMGGLSPNMGASSAGITRATGASEAGNCGRMWRILLSAEAITYDPVTINLAETEQRAAWDSNYCQNRLDTITRRHWANPSTFFNTHWFVIDSGSSQSPRWTYYPWTYADTYGYYQNDDFLNPNQSTWAPHTIEFTLWQNITYVNHSIVHTGELSELLDILSGDLSTSFYYY